ncbi:hypothetical protein F5I97DRAFT_944152 [Phlebopus sp. FC_14]|nr:hypothetical protein F5I97DRAFT_944152 [Phlebopus sp. FC_14]
MATVNDSTKDTSVSPSQPVKRPAFVYGRRKNTQVDQHGTTANNSDSTARNEGVDVSGPKDSDHNRAVVSTAQRASSSATASSFDDDDEADESGAAPAYQFDFRRQMRELDEKFDNDNELVEKSLPQKSPSLPSKPTERNESSPIDRPQRVAVDAVSLSCDAAHVSDDPFSGSLSPLTSSQPAASAQDLSSESPVVRRRARAREKHVVISDSEPDVPSNSSSVSPPRHSITTPHLRSPPTPPTSEFEMPTTKKKSGKSKGKAPVRDVLPLQFESEGPSTVAPPRKLNQGRRGESSKTKAPTKKERREALLESSRIAAGRSVDVARTQEAKHTLSSFFANLQHGSVAIPTPRAELQSDPIQNEFSSPADASAKVAPLAFGAPTALLSSSRRDLAQALDGQPSTPSAQAKVLPAPADSEDDEMPEFASIFKHEQEKREADEKQQQLQAMKLAALQQQLPDAYDEEDELEILQDDMHILAREEAAQRKLDKANGSPEKGKARILTMGHRVAPRVSNSRSQLLPFKFSEQNLRKFAKPSFIRNGNDSKEPLSKKQLDSMVMQQHEQEKLKLIKQREEEWIQRGGRLARNNSGENAQTSLSQKFEAYAKQRQRLVDDADTGGAVDDGLNTDESDGDYTPEIRGSASEGEGGSDQEHENAHSDNLNVSTDDEEDFAPSRRKSHVRRPARVIESDEEDVVRSRPRILVPDSSSMSLAASCQGMVTHRDSGSSMESQTEDENDKENNTKLMFDRSEDKENKAVVRHSPRSSWAALSSGTGRTLGFSDGVQRSLSLSSFAEFDVTTSPRQVVRSPLKEISKEDDDPFSLSPSVSRSERVPRNTMASPPRASSSKLVLGSPPVLQMGRARQMSAFSFDTENDENSAPSDKVVLQPLFLETLHNQHTCALSLRPLNPLPNGGLSQLFLDEAASSKKISTKTESEELSLTLDVGLKPALEVSGTLRRKADVIFEKEQEYVAAAGQKDDIPKEVLYVNDHGFLTQTRPEGESPQVYRMTPSQASKFMGTQVRSTQPTQPLGKRAPLRTLSFTSTQDSPELRPLRRLYRRSDSPLDTRTLVDGVRPLAPAPLITASSQRNAFEVLGKTKAASHTHNDKLGKSEFVAAEAEESDEDDMFGFGGRKQEDDEDDDEDDENRVVEGLVDDAVMNVDTERPDLIQEKFREHQEEDDRLLQKVHQDAVEGKFRVKRRDRGVGFEDDSEENDDDYEARRIRQRMHKKRKIDGDDLEALGRCDVPASGTDPTFHSAGQNEETRAFYNTYHQDLQASDDDDEFAHLREAAPVIDDDAAENEEREMVSVDEIRTRLREAAQNNMEVEVLNPEDTSWVDETMADDDDYMLRFKVMDKRLGKGRRPNVGIGPLEFDAERPKRHMENEQQQKMLRSWAKGQGNRHHGTGRSANGAAVTGHAAKVMNGGGSLRSARLGVASETRTAPSKVSKAPSMLSTVSDRSSRFV